MRKIPDTWIIVKVVEKFGTPRYKIFTGDYGGYGGADTWGLSSCLERFIDSDTPGCYTALTQSGSTYVLHQKSERLSGYATRVFESFYEDVKNLNDGSEFVAIPISQVINIESQFYNSTSGP